MELIVLAVSFVTNGIVFGAKKLAGLAMFSNGAEAKPFLRFTMILFCAIGVVAKSLVTRQEINPDSHLRGTVTREPAFARAINPPHEHRRRY